MHSGEKEDRGLETAKKPETFSSEKRRLWGDTTVLLGSNLLDMRSQTIENSTFFIIPASEVLSSISFSCARRRVFNIFSKISFRSPVCLHFFKNSILSVEIEIQWCALYIFNFRFTWHSEALSNNNYFQGIKAENIRSKRVVVNKHPEFSLWKRSTGWFLNETAKRLILFHYFVLFFSFNEWMNV